TDSIRKDPRVREVRGVASVRPRMSTLQLLFFYSDPAAARQKYAKFFDAYLSTDERTTLLDAIPADTLSLAGMMDVARHVRAAVLVFQHGYGGRLFGLEGPTEAIWAVVPVLVFAIVFGLSMDYEVFLLTRVKEVFDKTGRNDHATMEGLSATASTITSAAAIMILVFGTFAFARVLAVQLVGFGLAAAVLLDATLIRMVLVPAIMHIAGRWNWWPGVRAPRM